MKVLSWRPKIWTLRNFPSSSPLGSSRSSSKFDHHQFDAHDSELTPQPSTWRVVNGRWHQFDPVSWITESVVRPPVVAKFFAIFFSLRVSSNSSVLGQGLDADGADGGFVEGVNDEGGGNEGLLGQEGVEEGPDRLRQRLPPHRLRVAQQRTGEQQRQLPHLRRHLHLAPEEGCTQTDT